VAEFGGTAKELLPIAEQVLAWVIIERKRRCRIHPDELRRIELCALATREAAMFHALYGMEEEA
jgi:hypothetical protein